MTFLVLLGVGGAAMGSLDLAPGDRRRGWTYFIGWFLVTFVATYVVLQLGRRLYRRFLAAYQLSTGVRNFILLAAIAMAAGFAGLLNDALEGVRTMSFWGILLGILLSTVLAYSRPPVEPPD
jgi:hypothetical protein